MMPLFCFSTPSRTLIPLFFSLLLVIPQCLAQSSYLYSFCINSTNYTSGSQFSINLGRLLYRSLYINGGDSIFSNVTQGDDPDKVYGLSLCRGDVQLSVCQQCIDVAGVQIAKDCNLYKEAIIWYDECLIRYSYRSFFSTMETLPAFYMWNLENVTEPDKFNENLGISFSDLINRAISNPSKQYASSNTTATGFKTLFSMVQCTPDLSVFDCKTCLNVCVSRLLSLLSGKKGGRSFAPSCNIRYELYPFLNDPPVAAQPLPAPPLPAPNRNESGGGGGGGGNNGEF